MEAVSRLSVWEVLGVSVLLGISGAACAVLCRPVTSVLGRETGNKSSVGKGTSEMGVVGALPVTVCSNVTAVGRTLSKTSATCSGPALTISTAAEGTVGKLSSSTPASSETAVDVLL